MDNAIATVTGEPGTWQELTIKVWVHTSDGADKHIPEILEGLHWAVKPNPKSSSSSETT